MSTEQPRHRPPRAVDNSMASLAQDVLEEALRSVRTADDLVALMEPHVGRRYGNSAIYAYTNRRAVPPGDVLLAAALATGISLDDKLGPIRDAAELKGDAESLRAEMARLRREMASLRRQLSDGADGADSSVTDSETNSRRATRRQWARQSRSVAPPPEAVVRSRSARRAGP